jgi:hypothetical protein
MTSRLLELLHSGQESIILHDDDETPTIDEIKVLSDALRDNTTLKSLNAECISWKGLFGALTHNKSLKSLQICIESVDTELAKYLNGRTLYHLVLVDVLSIEAWGAQNSIVQLPFECINACNLTCLTIVDDSKDWHHSYRIIRSLKNNTRLRDLVMESFKIPKAACKWVANLLTCNSTLKSMTIQAMTYCNATQEDNLRSIYEALRRNTSLTQLRFGGFCTFQRSELNEGYFTIRARHELCINDNVFENALFLKRARLLRWLPMKILVNQ